MTGSNMSDALANAVCERCRARFDPTERIVNSNGELYHENCFVCAQCFRQFPDGLFYDVRSKYFWQYGKLLDFSPNNLYEKLDHIAFYVCLRYFFSSSLSVLVCFAPKQFSFDIGIIFLGK
ncbi:LIM and senescent cell antigen-like-containing domain protein 2 [Varanus komodoensis]|nr:LIM and senescent cell antigen-like-containing domain protein 2 [Varanus komodoensis]